ncbi:uncharacterized protein LOC122668800 [Telopea speciosissima]|uniref:uncharacterized protein LOC122668800 n=1 Tax=Telopea speciosissima TaxID=54955 RepID=UPI001CC82B6D|nr:uncharacterized protein LOC122668800 [Telopea speciosissima]
MVLSWIANSLDTEIAHSVLYASSAHEVWVDLHDRFSQKNAPRIFEIRRAISSHRQGTSSLATYYTLLKGFWDELASYDSYPACTCSVLQHHAELLQHDRLLEFLMGLNDSYTSIRNQLLLMDPLPSINHAYSLLLQEERQRSILAAPEPSLTQSALAAHGRPNSKSGRPKPHYHCDFCGLDGHSESRCFKKHGYPPKTPSKTTAPAPSSTPVRSLAASVVDTPVVPAHTFTTE